MALFVTLLYFIFLYKSKTTVWATYINLAVHLFPVNNVALWQRIQIQGVLCLHSFSSLWKNNSVNRKPCKRRSTKINHFIQKTMVLQNGVSYGSTRYRLLSGSPEFFQNLDRPETVFFFLISSSLFEEQITFLRKSAFFFYIPFDTMPTIYVYRLWLPWWTLF